MKSLQVIVRTNNEQALENVLANTLKRLDGTCEP